MQNGLQKNLNVIFQIIKIYQGCLLQNMNMQGGFNYEKMGILDRMIMKTLSKILSRKKDKSSDEAGFEQAIGSSYDISSREYIAPLIQFVKVQAKVVE